jgi:hypothetical protein
MGGPPPAGICTSMAAIAPPLSSLVTLMVSASVPTLMLSCTVSPRINDRLPVLFTLD